MGGLPQWAKGKQVSCVICGWWFGERDYRMRKRDGKFVCKWDWDFLLEKERVKSKN